MREQVEEIVSSVVGAGRARVQLAPISTTTRSPRPRTGSIPRAGWCARARRARSRHGSDGKEARSPSTTSCRAPRAAATPQQSPQGPEQEDRGNRQLRDFPHHQDRGDRSRPRQPHLGRGAGRRQSTARTKRARPPTQPRAKDELDRIATLVRSAIGFDQKRGDQVEVVNLRFADAPAAAAGQPSRPAGSASCSSPRTTSCTSSSSA